MRTLIVDDEPIARQVLRDELSEFPTVEIVGEAGDGESALSMMTSLAPDLVFLDLEMPVLGGLDVLRRIPGGHLPVVVIVTAYDSYAVRALEEGAIDYLLKPVAQTRLAQTIARAQRLAHDPAGLAETLARLQALLPAAQPLETRRKIAGRHGDDFFLLDPDEVLAFQADGELVWIITARGRLLATQTLKNIEERLQSCNFRRVHRNAIVNLDHVRKLSILSSQRRLVTLDNGQEFTVSKRQAKNIRDVLEW